MITLRDFMDTVNYRITEGSDYGWQCYGPNAHSLDSWNGRQDGHTVCVVFDTQNQVVYEATVCDYSKNKAYRLINPDFRAAYDEEAEYRGVEANEAWDEVNYVDLETDDDFLNKARAVVAGEDYDTRVEVPLELDDNILFDLMKMAHEQDITLNTLVERIVRGEIDRLEHQRIEDELNEIRRELEMIDLPKHKKSSKKKSKKS
jgi:hypothetical protein